MIAHLSAQDTQFLADLDLLRQTSAQAQQQSSSGLKIQVASDAPQDVVSILSLQGELNQNKQTTANLTRVQSEVNAGESALQTAVQVIQQANVIGTQGANSIQTAAQRTTLAGQIQSAIEQLVGLTKTSVAGNYIFSGDQNQSVSYVVNPNSGTGVSRKFIATNTQQVQDPSGVSFPTSRTAQDIFDQRDASDNPTAGNVFSALGALKTALLNNDQTGITTALSSLSQAAGHVNDELSSYGIAQDRVTAALNFATTQKTNQTISLGQLRDADMAAAALQLTSANNQIQAALAGESKLPRTSLFSFLG
jgi:flagellar hook-associated protein 3 FlgL